MLTIVGVGLIGGSLGLAVKQRGLFSRVRGVARHSSSLEAAIATGAVDETSTDAVAASRGADMVVVATPVSTIPDFCVECAAVATDGAVITDVGSVKSAIHDGVKGRMPRGRHYVGSHPLAGSEKRGVVNARADLLSGAKCIVTRSDDTDPDAYERLAEFWKAVGMEVFTMSPAEHDAVLASVSHLPHLAAAALVSGLPESALPFGASGLRDTTRVASGDARLWRDIAEANRREILSALDSFQAEVAALRKMIADGDFDSMETYLADAAAKRGRRFPQDEEGRRT